MTRTDSMNLYGDRLVPTTGFHGSNVSSQRIDELDTACLDFIRQRMEERGRLAAIDIGGGNGAQARRMAELGATVTFVDLTDQRQAIDAFNHALGRRAIDFHQVDIRSLDLAALAPPFDVIYSQRMMGCIRHADLRRLLKSLFEHATAGARCFVSASGLDTEYGATYPHRDLPVEERFAPIAQELAAKHQMYAPECLYREHELVELVAACGFTLITSWRSPFGTPKVIAERR